MKLKCTTLIAFEWAIRCFGADHVYNKSVRALRLAEEAIELCQAVDVPKEKLHELIDMVYTRPRGDATQELGGVMMTTHVLAASMGYDPNTLFEHELRRVLAKSPEHFAKRNQEKLDAGLDG